MSLISDLLHTMPPRRDDEGHLRHHDRRAENLPRQHYYRLKFVGRQLTASAASTITEDFSAGALPALPGLSDE